MSALSRVRFFLKYRIVYPLGFWLIIFKLYKNQVLAENRVIAYNRSLR